MSQGNDDIKLEETRPFAMVERAKELVRDATDLGKDVTQLFSLALVLAEIERFRLETNETVAQLKKVDIAKLGPVLSELVKLVIKDFDGKAEIPPGSLPPPDVLKMMTPAYLSRARTDIKFAMEIITLLQLAKEED
jgi:hypothetical protein